jgi:hypothetical protein
MGDQSFQESNLKTRHTRKERTLQEKTIAAILLPGNMVL